MKLTKKILLGVTLLLTMSILVVVCSSKKENKSESNKTVTTEKKSIKVGMDKTYCPICYVEDGYSVLKTDAEKELLKSVNKAIKEMHEDGTLSKISEKVLNIDSTKKTE